MNHMSTDGLINNKNKHIHARISRKTTTSLCLTVSSHLIEWQFNIRACKSINMMSHDASHENSLIAF